MTTLSGKKIRRHGLGLAIVLTGVGLAGLLALSHPVWAHTGATGIVKQRMDLMKSIGQSMKMLTEMMRGKRPYDKALAVKLATSLSEHSKKIDKAMFPQGSNKPPSEALPIIWEDWAGFEKIAKDLEAQSAELANAAANGTQTGSPQAISSRWPRPVTHATPNSG